MRAHSIDVKTAVSVLVLALGWHLSATPAVANIGTASLASTGSTTAMLTFSHSGFEARNFPFGVASGSPYRICWRQLNQVGLACMYYALNTSSQQVLLSGLTVGLPINITIQCYCGRERAHGLSGPFGDRIVADMDYTHQAPPPVAGLVSSTNVRARGVQSGQCLFINSSNAFVRGWPCWNDPAMVFALETFSDGSKRLHHVQSGLCIAAVRFISAVVALPCDAGGSKLAVIPQPGPGSPVLVRFLFVPAAFGSCLMANTSNGLNATKENCNMSGPLLPLILDPV